jgi:hypothetical protein
MQDNKESFKKRYNIINRISEGNFGCVYKALDKHTSNLFLKKTRMSLLKNFLLHRGIKNRDQLWNEKSLFFLKIIIKM